MTGEELRKKLLDMGVQQKELAEKLGMTRQNFNQGLKVADVKSGLLESICDILDITMADLYGLKISVDTSKAADNADEVRMSRASFEHMMALLDRQSRQIEELTNKKAIHALETPAVCAAAK